MKKLLLVVFVASFFSSAAFCQLKEEPFPYTGKKTLEMSDLLEKRMKGDTLSDTDILEAIYFGDTDTLNSFTIDRYLRSEYQGQEFLSISVYAALDPAWPNREYFRSLAMKLIQEGVDVSSCPEYKKERHQTHGLWNMNEGGSFRWCAWKHLFTKMKENPSDRKQKFFLSYNHKDPIFTEMFKRAKNIPFEEIDYALGIATKQFFIDASRKGLTEYIKYVLQNSMGSYSNPSQALKNFLRSSDILDDIAEFYLAVTGDSVMEERFRSWPDLIPHPSAKEEGIMAWHYVQWLYLQNGIPLPDTNYVKRMKELDVNKIPA